MRKIFLLFFFSFIPLSAQPKILVSIAPQKYLVEQIGEERVSVEVIVPDGASPHTYEPTPRQAIGLAKGEIWFRVGESFEHRLIKILNRKKVDIVDQREGIDLLPLECCCHSVEAHDSHIWLSPSLLKLQGKQITRVLSEHYPESTSFFEKNYAALCLKLDTLDQEITSLLENREGAALLVTHPAFGYFCREYGLKQISIEQEGREPSSKQLINLLAEARTASIRSVYLQKQYSVKGGQKIAKELNAKTVMIDPYKEDVIANLKFLAETL
ncbi:MAG: High-affinity zinc uptake system binding-protein ZnuA [Chlamydiales bacterium]|nr:High-affinity zinc uptake system binding-protein ZnuA [Chlamydiales bacterium]MCH9619291.1 High-affinity zinc uptake system binding-protein ZnuA [Chlamydiales bacterium]MCH9622553.1 High-affinity zinc uptake system binding-protein ZnuA [Chlamydiales bacterium]